MGTKEQACGSLFDPSSSPGRVLRVSGVGRQTPYELLEELGEMETVDRREMGCDNCRIARAETGIKNAPLFGTILLEGSSRPRPHGKIQRKNGSVLTITYLVSLEGK